MKLNAKSQLGILFQESASWRQEILDGYLTPEKLEMIRDFHGDHADKQIDLIKRSFNDAPARNLLITGTVQEMAEKVQISDAKFDHRIFNDVKDQKHMYLLGNGKMFIYEKRDEEIRAVRVTYDWNTMWLEFSIFSIDTAKGVLKASDDELTDTAAKEFMQLLIFVELADIEIEVLDPGKKIGKTRSDKILNGTDYKVVIVDSSWNKYVIRTEGFGVKGHLRLQPYGPGLSRVKPIWINAFKKKGYIRTPKKGNL